MIHEIFSVLTNAPRFRQLIYCRNHRWETQKRVKDTAVDGRMIGEWERIGNSADNAETVLAENDLDEWQDKKMALKGTSRTDKTSRSEWI